MPHYYWECTATWPGIISLVLEVSVSKRVFIACCRHWLRKLWRRYV